mmetsp:Transcript_19114/g.52688  ORF Transcript_19114/g.52688 Transcript_19114/m.52688 type:complete len:217 (+) Transcript_19114:1-651(+)
MPIKLVYFNGRGLAEVARYLLHIAGVAYEDYRWPISADFKRPEFDKEKEAGAFDVNMGRIPILEVDGAQIGQSQPIVRYLARKYGFAGSNDIEEAQIDMICEHVRDIKDAYQKVRGITNEDEKKAATDKWFGTDLPEWLRKLEKSFPASAAAGFSVGTKLSAADVTLYYFLSFFFDNKEAAAAAAAACPRIQAVVTAVKDNAKVKEWEAKRPVTPF